MARRLVLAVVGIAGLTLVGSLTAAADGPSPLVEAATCAAPTGKVPAATSSPGQTQVSFDVPATTRLQVGPDGAVVAVATNTGCAPRPSDVFVTDDGGATTQQVREALEIAVEGDWRQLGS